MTRKHRCLIFNLLVAALLSSPAFAVVIPYGDFLGDNVMYLSVTEDTHASPVALFGSPDIVGDTLDFDPLSFSASANSTSGSQNTDGQLTFTLMSNVSSFGISQVVIDEAGDYTLVGPPGALADATVGTQVQFQVTHVDGVATAVPVGNALMTFSPNASGMFSFPADSGTTLPWDGHLDLDIDGFLAANSIMGRATRIEFTIDNALTAAAANGGSAFIAKKDFSGVTISIPEPGAMLSVLSGLAACLLWVRRR